MTVFSKENVARAETRIPATDTRTRTLRMWVERGRAQGLEEFASACERELTLRGPVELDRDQAAFQASLSQETQDMALEDAIAHGFRKVPPSGQEMVLLPAIAANPGISFSELRDLYGKGDLGLVIGHLVHDRIGSFRRWIAEGVPMSDVLVERDHGGPSVRYTLRPEALCGLRKAGALPGPASGAA